jgi:branched-chain amino acid transport system substrate-binding protein
MTDSNKHETSRSRRDFVKAVGLGAGSVALLAGLNGEAVAKEAEPVIVGAPLPLTGVVAADGIEFRRGLEMAADEINKLGGILGRPIKVVFEDTQSGGDDLISSAGQRLVDRGNANVLISGYNFGSQTVLQGIAADASIPYLHTDTASAHIKLIQSDPKKYWGSFMYDPPEAMYGVGFLNFLKSIQGSGQFKPANNKIAIITGPITYSITIANAIKENAAKFGYEISLYETVQAPISQWGPTLAKLRADPPGMIAVTHFFPQDQAQFMIQFMNNPTNSLIYMQYGASLAAFRDIAGKASEGVLYATTIGALQDEIGLKFAKAYTDRFGATSSPNSGGQTYSALHLYAIAASVAGGVGKPYEDKQNRKIAEQIKTMIYRSPMGAIHFDLSGQVAYSYPSQTVDSSLGMPHIFSQIQDKSKAGEIISPAPYDVGKFVLPSWMKA